MTFSVYILTGVLYCAFIFYMAAKFDFNSEPIANEVFGTKEAYTFYYLNQDEKNYHGEYLLLFDDKIIHLDVEEQLNDRQTSIVKEKLY